jgi:hypothetical protein
MLTDKMIQNILDSIDFIYLNLNNMNQNNLKTYILNIDEEECNHNKNN